ncbi:hypothetical protein [Streptomyces yangpuensis]|uniref:hypothetical protein n=1 Tax=Streptomyces yangpuensis TaxID=1648182 RepID=UPI0036517356
MTDIELELSFAGDDAELQEFIEKALRASDGIVVGRIRQIRTVDLLTVIELTGTAVGLADGLLGLRDRVRAFLARRAADRNGAGAAATLEVANTEGEAVPLLRASDSEVRSVVSDSDPEDGPAEAAESTPDAD